MPDGDWLKLWFGRIWHSVEKWFFIPLVFIIFVLLLAWSIDSVRVWLQHHGLKELDVPAVVGIALAATMLVLVSFEQQVKQTNARLTSLEPQLKAMDRRLSFFSPEASSKIIPGGVTHVYPEIRKVLEDLAADSNVTKVFDVLGLTLYTAWNLLLNPGLTGDGPFQGWTVNVFCLSPDFVKKNSCFSAAWQKHSEVYPDIIKDFVKVNALLLEEARTKLVLSHYEFFPAVHGFRTQAGHLFVSYVHWNGQLLGDPHEFYEFFPPSDKSARAKVYRNLFDNWIERARREPTTMRVV